MITKTLTYLKSNYYENNLEKIIICIYYSDSHLNRDVVRYKNQQSPLAASEILA